MKIAQIGKILSLLLPLFRYDLTLAHITENTKILLRTCFASQKEQHTYTTQHTNNNITHIRLHSSPQRHPHHATRARRHVPSLLRNHELHT